jgi:sulfur-oxidizing protein SoxX
MRNPGFRPLRRKSLARAFSSEVEAGSRQENASNRESRATFRFHRNGRGSRCIRISGLVLAGALFAGPGFATAEETRGYTVVGDAIPEPLTKARGDATRGRALVVERSSTCILCHSGPFPEQKFQGDLAPDLSGSGSRWSEGQLRLRLVDASRLNAATIMPSYYRVDGHHRVGTLWRGKSILSAEQIEDIVAYLASLRE